MRLKRFTPTQKAFHVLLMLTFLVQAVTGTARMYIESRWGNALAQPFGGYEGCLAIHKYTGLFMLFLFVCHVVYACVVLSGGKTKGEDALWPRSKDFQQFFRHICWMFGGKAPRFERWGYWEKFDYWAVFWGMAILGVTGLMLYNPLGTTAYFKGWSLNVALWVHRIEACLAMLHIFIIHFAVAHLRPHNFPMDRAMFAGDADLKSASAERPAWVERLRNEGRLEQKTGPDASIAVAAISYLVGLSAVAIGVYLVIGGLVNVFLVNW